MASACIDRKARNGIIEIMAKGATCLNCGEQTWKKGNKGGRFCSSCNAKGWLGTDKGPTGGGGAGKECKLCGTKTLQLADSEVGVQIRRCSSCNGVVITSP